jgi:hypothetical protein
MSDDPKKALDDKLDAMIEKFGWAHISVGMDGEDRANFTYTIGFQDLFGIPEVLIMALPPASASALLHGIADQLKKREIQIPAAGGRVGQIIKGYDTLFVPVPDDIANNTALAAKVRQKDKPFAVIQMLWPDTSGHFPGEEGCDPKISRAQMMSDFAD